VAEAQRAPGIWVKRDRTPVRICDMSDDHLLNTIRMLRRAPRLNWVTDCWAFRAMDYAVDAPDGASMAAESWANSIMMPGPEQDDLFAKEYPVFGELLDEARRRKLKTNA
jgi:hypothetical protein